MKNNKIKIAFFGTPQFSIPCLKSLLENNRFDVATIITQEDKAIGRKNTVTPTAIKEFALNNGFDPAFIIQKDNINKDLKTIEKLKSLNCDFFVVVAFGQILNNTVLKLPKYGSINVHGSLLPKYRGASPIHQSLLNGDKFTGLTIMEMVKKMDAGDILAQKSLEIENTDNLQSLSEKMSLLGADLLIETLVNITNNNAKKIAQNELQASYCKKINKEDGKIDFLNDTSLQIINKIRAYSQWPSCYCMLNEKKIKIIKASIDLNHFGINKTAGETFLDKNQNLNIKTIDGSIIVEELQLEGKNITKIHEFLRGYPLFKNAELR